MNKEYYVYLCFVDNVLRYIGKGKKDRYKHCTSGHSHVEQLNLAVAEGLDVYVIIYKKNMCDKEASKLEKFMISKHKGTLYNSYIDVAAPKDMVIDERFDQCKGFMFNGEFIKLNNTDKLVYSSMRDLIETTDEGIDEVFVTQQTLADKYGVSIKTIQRALAKFINYGFIAEKNTRGRCNTYIMNDIDNVDFRSEYINKNMKRDTSFAADYQPENTRWSKT